MQVTIIKTLDTITPELTSLAATLKRPRGLLDALGKELAVQLKTHFAWRNAKKNAKGWPSKNFWAHIGNTVKVGEVTDESATVIIAHPNLAQKIYGGPITPKRAKSLAIPACAAAYKAGSPRELDENFLKFVPIKNRGNFVGILVTRAHTQVVWGDKGPKKGKRVKGGTLWYYLLKSVTTKPDDRALPYDKDIYDRLLARAYAYVDRNYIKKENAS